MRLCANQAVTHSLSFSNSICHTLLPSYDSLSSPLFHNSYYIILYLHRCVTRLADLASSHLHQEQVRTPTSSAPVSPGEPSNAFLGERAFAAHSANQPDAPAQLQAWAAAAAASGLNMESGALGGAPSGNWMSDSSSSSSTSSGSAAAAGGATGNEPAAAGAAGAGGVDARLPLTGEQLPQTAAEAQAGWWLITADHSPEVCGCFTDAPFFVTFPLSAASLCFYSLHSSQPLFDCILMVASFTCTHLLSFDFFSFNSLFFQLHQRQIASHQAPTEFERLRRTRPSSNNPTLPELLMVYDSPSGSVPKASCAPIFALRPQNPAGVPTVTNS